MMAVIGLTTTLAAEVGPLGISVNSLSPGSMARPTNDDAIDGRRVTEPQVGLAVLAILQMPGLCGADIDLSAGRTTTDDRLEE